MHISRYSLIPLQQGLFPSNYPEQILIARPWGQGVLSSKSDSYATYVMVTFYATSPSIGPWNNGVFCH